MLLPPAPTRLELCERLLHELKEAEARYNDSLQAADDVTGALRVAGVQFTLEVQRITSKFEVGLYATDRTVPKDPAELRRVQSQRR